MKSLWWIPILLLSYIVFSIMVYYAVMYFGERKENKLRDFKIKNKRI